VKLSVSTEVCVTFNPLALHARVIIINATVMMMMLLLLMLLTHVDVEKLESLIVTVF